MIRWDFQVALQTWLATEVTPGNGYTVDLSPGGAVTNGIATPEERLNRMTTNEQVQIEEGREEHTIMLASPDTQREANFETILSCLIRGNMDKGHRQRVNEFLGDVNLAIHKNPSMTSTVRRVHVARVDPPIYHVDSRVAEVNVRCLAMYFYMAGTNI